MSAALAHAEAPSAELLLYLAEFADERGQPEDPMAVDGAMNSETGPKARPPSSVESEVEPEDAPAKPAAKDR